MLGPDWLVEVTDLVSDFMRVGDPRVPWLDTTVVCPHSVLCFLLELLITIIVTFKASFSWTISIMQ